MIRGGGNEWWLLLCGFNPVLRWLGWWEMLVSVSRGLGARLWEEVRANEARNRGGLKEFEEKGAYIPQCRDPFVQSQACLTRLPHSPISLNLVLLD